MTIDHGPQPQNEQQKRGFTLIETMLSLTIFLIIMTMVGAMFNQFLSGTSRMTSVMSTYDGVRIFGTQITSELGTAMVRVNENRWLNLKVELDESESESESESGDAGTRIFFTSPDDNLRSIGSLNFISHYVYFWKRDEQALYRAVYNTRTDPTPLAQTGVDPANKNRVANQQRLARMTLAYRSGEPYGWTKSREMKELMDQEKYEAILKNVFDFKVHCYDLPKNEDTKSKTVWADHQRLPLFVELELFVAHTRMAAGLRQEIEETGSLSEDSYKKLRRFVITVPLRNHGINDSSVY